MSQFLSQRNKVLIILFLLILLTQVRLTASLPHKLWCVTTGPRVCERASVPLPKVVFFQNSLLVRYHSDFKLTFLAFKSTGLQFISSHRSWLQPAVTRGTWLSHLFQLLSDLGLAIILKWMVETIIFYSFALSRESLESHQSNFLECYSFVSYLMEAQLTCYKHWSFFSSKFKGRFNLNCTFFFSSVPWLSSLIWVLWVLIPVSFLITC